MLRPSLGPLGIGVFAAALALALQWAKVELHYGGNWSALFYTGDAVALSPAVARENPYRFAHSSGFDGQFYHAIAHDPWMRDGSRDFTDNARLRWRRILVPALAWALALGRGQAIDAAYAAVILGFVFLGAWWTAAWCRRFGWHSAFGLGFLAVPAVAVSLERYTVDAALAALCAGFALRAPERIGPATFAILALAPLARETGLALIAAAFLVAVSRRDARSAALAASASVPCLLWIGWVHARTAPADAAFASAIPFEGLWNRTWQPLQFHLGSHWLALAAAFDYAGVAGIWIALGLALLAVRRHSTLADPLLVFSGTFVAFLVQPQAWDGVYTFGRTMSPLLIWTAMTGLGERSWLHLVPLASTAPRLLLQVASPG
ncbi:MAG: hypothetical protein U0Q16_08580 [Bryobacteraceae bacterium]